MFQGSDQEAAEYYFHHERETPTGRSTVIGCSTPERNERGGSDGSAENESWSSSPEAIDLREAPQFGEHGTRAVRILVADEHGSPRRIFEQGDWVRVYVVYQVDECLTVRWSGYN